MISPVLNRPALDLERLEATLTEVQRLVSLGSLTAGVAHELINPLSIITTTCNNLLRLAADGQIESEELLHYLEIVDRSAWRCVRLAEALRTYSFQGETEFSATDLNQVIENAISMVSYQIERNLGTVIQVDLEPELTPITCDEIAITQVLVNLLLNARDALPEGGGTIAVRSWLVPTGDAQACSVSDSGTGIDPEHLERIFDPFFTTKPAGKGTGLGLAIAAEIVDRHRGTIRAENNPGGGATFTVILPDYQPDQ